MNTEKRKKNQEVPIYEKSNLKIEEAALYSGVGKKRIRALAKRNDADFALYCGRKLLIKRLRFDSYLEHEMIISRW